MKNLGIISVAATLNEKTRSLHWRRNHLSIKLEDKDGNWSELVASGVLVGKCTECHEGVLALTNSGKMNCTHCNGSVVWAWSKPQLSFLPEEESSFRGWDRGKNPARERARKAKP